MPGAYSESAARKACPNAEPLPCEQFEVAFQALSQWVADTAVLPIENSLGGSIHTVYDLLLRYRLHIIGEVSVEVNHCLMALPGVQKKDIKRVQSHPQALAQVDNYLRSSLPRATKEAVDDTAGAAQAIAKQGWRCGNFSTMLLHEVSATSCSFISTLIASQVPMQMLSSVRNNFV